LYCAGIRAEGDDSALHYSANGILYVLRLAYCKNKFGDVGCPMKIQILLENVKGIPPGS
jgi:hypothetical protein